MPAGLLCALPGNRSGDRFRRPDEQLELHGGAVGRVARCRSPVAWWSTTAKATWWLGRTAIAVPAASILYLSPAPDAVSAGVLTSRWRYLSKVGLG